MGNGNGSMSREMWPCASGVAFSNLTDIVSFPAPPVEDDVNGSSTLDTSSHGGIGRLRTGIIGMLILLLFDAPDWYAPLPLRKEVANGLMFECEFVVGDGGGSSGKRRTCVVDEGASTLLYELVSGNGSGSGSGEYGCGYGGAEAEEDVRDGMNPAEAAAVLNALKALKLVKPCLSGLGAAGWMCCDTGDSISAVLEEDKNRDGYCDWGCGAFGTFEEENSSGVTGDCVNEGDSTRADTEFDRGTAAAEDGARRQELVKKDSPNGRRPSLFPPPREAEEGS